MRRDGWVDDGRAHPDGVASLQETRCSPRDRVFCGSRCSECTAPPCLSRRTPLPLPIPAQASCARRAHVDVGVANGRLVIVRVRCVVVCGNAYSFVQAVTHHPTCAKEPGYCWRTGAHLLVGIGGRHAGCIASGARENGALLQRCGPHPEATVFWRATCNMDRTCLFCDSASVSTSRLKSGSELQYSPSAYTASGVWGSSTPQPPSVKPSMVGGKVCQRARNSTTSPKKPTRFPQKTNRCSEFPPKN